MTETTELEIPDAMRLEDVTPEPAEHPEADHDEGERRSSPRDDAMAEIARRRREAIDRELRQGEDYADDARRDAGLEPLAHARDEAKPVESKPVETPVETRRSTTRDIEIDGHVFQVSEEQMAELARLGARTNIAMQRHHAAPQQPVPQAAPPRQEPTRASLSKEDAESIADRLLYGGKQQVAETVQALADHLVQQARGQQVAPDVIAQEATRRALEYHQMQSDLTTISKEYPDLWQSRALGELAAVQLTHLRQEDAATGIRRSNLDSYREACGRVLDALGKPRPGVASPAAQAASTSTTDRSQVLERKRAAPSSPAAIDRRAGAHAQTTRAKSGAEIVAMMRKARGQIAMN